MSIPHIKGYSKCPKCTTEGYPKECSVKNCGGMVHSQISMSIAKTKRDTPKLISTDLWCDSCGHRETIFPEGKQEEV
jgi:hypothetical protein